jgi:hypothetical protein
VRLDLDGRSGSRFDEAWLQNLLHNRPEVFPTEQIEPGFGDLIPLCRELTVSLGAGRTGSLDNLYVTKEGGLVFVEAKLWRNPEARRSVVAQAMEYASAIFRMSFSELQAAVLRARSRDERAAQSLAEIVSWQTPDLDEAEFIDAICRNLSRGRAIIAVVGDGIRADILPLAEMLQSHAGHRFTFALVELAIYEAPKDGVRIVIPSVLAQTTLIERGVIRFEGADAHVRVDAPDIDPGARLDAKRGLSIGEDEFFEVLFQRDPACVPFLRAFLEKAEDLGLYVERKHGLNLKHASPEGNPLNLGTISKEGFIDTAPATWWGRTECGRRYNEALAKASGGTIKELKEGAQSALRVAGGKTPRISDLLPQHEGEWLRAIQRYISESFNGSSEAH